MYWFKDKTTFFGDWIVLPEGADSLSQYYELVADATLWLHENVYNGSSPGEVPTAYPQTAKYLNTLAKNIPSKMDLEVMKGYAVVVDTLWLVIVLCFAFGVLMAIIYVYLYGYDIRAIILTVLSWILGCIFTVIVRII
ncbi:hypothetical protein B6U99_00050 [Candidatus Geothermarchaeota archaeon ex4572_27]|nr:MAG: hypothetical protein B6U99_00050 [Candidatus Geothermarchaeota archaeon ex4572_27]